MRRLQRRLVRCSVAAILLASIATSWIVPPALAECFPRTPAETHVVRPFVFTATVLDVATEIDQQMIDAGEGSGVLWRTTLAVTHVYRGSVPETLELAGSTSDQGYGGGCTYFLGDRVKPGEGLFIALDDQIAFDQTAFEKDSNLYGNVLLWRAVDGGWAFHAEALQEGDDPSAYPVPAREARTTAQVLAAIDGRVPDTSTSSPGAPTDQAVNGWIVMLEFFSVTTLVAWLLYARLRRGRERRG
jgi:hypothetical protein